MSIVQSLGSGLVGATALTLVHETVRQVVPTAPRMDLLGVRALGRAARGLDREPPARGRLHDLALVADLASNAAYFGLVGAGRPEGAIARGAVLGLAAGIGGVVLPGALGLGRAPSSRTPGTALMTVGWYLLGGLAAGYAHAQLARRRDAGRSSAAPEADGPPASGTTGRPVVPAPSQPVLRPLQS